MRWEKASPSWRVMADTVIAGLLGTGMAWGQAQWRQGARRAEAVEAAFPIHTGAALPAGAGRTLVDLHVAERPWGAHRQPQPQARTTQPTEGDALEQGHSPSHNTSALLQTGTATSSAQSCPAPRSSSSPNLHEVIFIFTEDHVGPTQKHPRPIRTALSTFQDKLEPIWGRLCDKQRDHKAWAISLAKPVQREGQNPAKKDGRFHPHPLRPPSHGSPLPTCEARLADTVIAIDTVPANSEGAGVAGTIVDVHLTVHTCRRRTRQG